jgi:ubiquinone/menaquinone biosynthesis C-methylase UbiE
MQSEPQHNAAHHWNGLHVNERFRPVYPSESVVRFLMGRFRERLSAGQRLCALDIGVGGGRHTRLLCELGFDTSGVDISAAGLKHTEELLARLGLHASLKQGPMTELPFETNAFDAAISYGVFYYGTESDMRQAIAELYRVLKAGGQAFVVMRTTDDFRYGKGEALEPDTYVIKIAETNEEGTVQHFLSESALRAAFAVFSGVEFERMEYTFSARTAKDSDWLISLMK